MNRPPQDYSGIAVAAPVTFGYVRRSDHETPWFLGRALAALLERSGVRKAEIDGLAVASYTLSPDHSASLAEHFGLTPRALVDIPFGGASGVVALRRAARLVQAGDAEIVACLAADVVPAGSGIAANFSRFARDYVYPYGAGGANTVFALITAHYMREFGATREDFGRLCVQQRGNGMRFPSALLRTPLSLADYLAARPIAEPLHLYDCVMRCCGAEAFIVMTEDRARFLRLPYACIGSAVERHNGFNQDPVQVRVGIAQDRDDLYAQAGFGPGNMSFLQAYDDYPVIVMLQVEELGFCEKGGAADFLRTRSTLAEGDFPINTSGGMLSLGQAGAAGGFVGMTEALRQLTGEPLGAAVPDARIGLVSGYGNVNYDRGICSAAAILTRASEP